jgi:RNA recognition motif-containing protein
MADKIDKMSMSLDDIVKASRSAKEASKPTAGGKAKKERGGGREAPYSKKEKQDAPPKKEKEKKERKERPPAEPSTLVFVGGLPFTLEAAALEAHLAAVAPCTVDLKTRTRGGVSKPAGYAIATFESIESATAAIEKLHETELGGRKIAVRFASPE